MKFIGSCIGGSFRPAARFAQERGAAIICINRLSRYIRSVSNGKNMSLLKPSISADGRISTLEGIRGIAALVVVIWHTTLAFAPEYSGLYSSTEAFTKFPLFFLLNGTAAVTLFFVLSAFVLTRRAINNGDTYLVIASAIKRYPRLILPVLASVMISWILFSIDAYYFEQAAAISKSPWLAHFGNAYEEPFTPDFFSALRQGLYSTFFTGEIYYNTSLWTMKIELIGSFIAFGLALLCISMKQYSVISKLYLFGIIGLLARTTAAPYTAFILGVLLANFLPNSGTPIGTKVRIIACGFALFLLGYYKPDGAYEFLDGRFVFECNLIGSAMLIILTYDLKLKGKLQTAALYLGELSFPIYLIHISIIFTLSSLIYIELEHKLQTFLYLQMVFYTLLLSIIAAMPMIYINIYWVRYVNRTTKRLFL